MKLMFAVAGDVQKEQGGKANMFLPASPAFEAAATDARETNGNNKKAKRKKKKGGRK
jgi:hypothetical protein